MVVKREEGENTMLATKQRNYQVHPLNEPSTSAPLVRRASAVQRNTTGSHTTQHEGATATSTSIFVDDDEPVASHVVTSAKLPNTPIAGTKSGTTSGRMAPGQWYSGLPILVQLLLCSGALVALYSIVFLVGCMGINISNTLAYGPTHTAYTTATLDGEPSTIVTSNIGGTISVTIIHQKDGSAKTYPGPTLNADAWNNDLGSIVATTQVSPQGTIKVDLVGSPSYFHLFFWRPTMQFSLVPDGQGGYKVVQP